MSTSEFSERPLVAGSLTGVRAYRVRADGALYGINFPQVVRPGENEATCLSVGHSMSVALRRKRRLLEGLPPVEEPPHELVTLGCTCGFYAFFDGSSDYLRSFGGVADVPRVEAIVEGYGKVVVGSRGFRAEKLRLVAVIHRTKVEPGKAKTTRRDRVARWLANRPNRTLALTASGLAGTLATAALGGFQGIWWFVPAYIGMTATLGTVWLHRRGQRLLMEDYLESLFGPLRGGTKAPVPSAAHWKLIEAQYPGVPVYPTRKAALAAHPLTVPEDAS